MTDDEHSPVSMAESLRRWQAGEPAGFVAALRPWQDPMFRIMERILCSRHDAEDAWQTLVLRLWNSPGILPSTEKFPAWLRRCAVNEALRRLRQKKAQPQVLVESLPSSRSGPLDELTENELRKRMAEALGAMSADERTLLALRFDEGSTIREIADVVEQPRGTVHDRLEQAVGRLRRLLNINSIERNDHASANIR